MDSSETRGCAAAGNGVRSLALEQQFRREQKKHSQAHDRDAAKEYGSDQDRHSANNRSGLVPLLVDVIVRINVRDTKFVSRLQERNEIDELLNGHCLIEVGKSHQRFTTSC